MNSENVHSDADRIAQAFARPLIESRKRIAAKETALLYGMVRLALLRGMDRSEIVASLIPAFQAGEIDCAITLARASVTEGGAL